PAEYFEDVYQAASDTQKRMGIHARNRFRRYPSEGDAPKKSSC
ncbi:PerC family transcriptional regulator, partial [Salmonella enterica]|nr:PerC family transcriptional regulator [Salmonella enterica]